MERTVDDLPERELIRRVIASLASRPIKRWGGVPLWSKVGETFNLGSGYSAQLCKRYDIDPNMMVRK